MRNASPALLAGGGAGGTVDASGTQVEIELSSRGGCAPSKPANIVVWRSALRIASWFFEHPATRRRAIALSLVVLALLLSETYIMLWYSEVQKHYMTALQKKDLDGFHAGIVKIIALIMLCVPVFGLNKLSLSFFQVYWRSSLTQSLAKVYLAGEGACANAFYRLYLNGGIDNPDQRICQDIDEFVTTATDLVTSLAATVFKVFGFAGVLYAMSPSICVGLMAYVLFGTVVSARGFGPPIMRYQNERRKQEATLRYCLVRTRENAESIAFFRGGQAEWLRFQELFENVLLTIKQGILLLTSYSMFRQTFNFAHFSIAPFLLGPRYLRGEVEFGAIAQSNIAFQIILYRLAVIMWHLESLSALSAQVTRLDEMEQALHCDAETSRKYSGNFKQSGSIVMEEFSAGQANFVLELVDFTLRTPSRLDCVQQILIHNLSLQLQSGESLLVVGGSGIGKSSLLRGLAGLWGEGAGTIRRHFGSAVFFMPQQPYMFLGTLQEQLLYPDIGRPALGALEKALQDVGLAYLLKRHSLHDVKDWAGILSLGERQRINFARVLLQPNLRLALIDEGTSACDTANEERLYLLLQSKLPSYVSVGHRPNLRKFHTHALRLYIEERNRTMSSFNRTSLGDEQHAPDGWQRTVSSSTSASARAERQAIEDRRSGRVAACFAPMAEFEYSECD